MDVNDLVAALRTEGNDTDWVEAKLAESGVPDRLANTLSAFANRPGGGVIVFGLDEKQGFAARGVFDTRALKQAVADLARKGLEPPVIVNLETAQYEGVELVITYVSEAVKAHKPIKVRRTQNAYLRQYDGTFTLSELEIQTFVANRNQPEFDIGTTKATFEDLDQDALARFAKEQRSLAELLSRWKDEQLLRHAQIINAEATPTVSGLLAFGLYPQGLLPDCGIQASCWTGSAKKATSQLIDSRALVGPIPVLLEQAITWVARNTAIAIEARTDGHLYDRPAYPRIAVRELVANALVHRDLSPYAANSPVSLILEPGQLIITNPGGLYGLTIDHLGRTDSHLRNPHLAQILLTARTPDGQRVIERLGSGIPRARSALEEAGLNPPIFHDTGLRFTARIQLGQQSLDHSPRLAHRLRSGRHDQTILEVLTRGEATVASISTATGLTPRQVRNTLFNLGTAGLVTSKRRSGTRTLEYSVL